MAQDYVQQIAAGDPSWFIICGTPGCGKTTLCTTIFRAIVEGGKPGLYVSWREFARSGPRQLEMIGTIFGRKPNP